MTHVRQAWNSRARLAGWLVGAIGLVAGCSASTAGNAPTIDSSGPPVSPVLDVERVLDPVTILLSDGEHVRVADVALASRTGTADPAAAMAALDRLVNGGVVLERLTSSAPTGALAYVWTTRGTMVNEELLRAGLLVQLPNGDNRYKVRLVAAQNDAREAHAGVWGETASSSTATPAVTTTEPAPTTTQPAPTTTEPAPTTTEPASTTTEPASTIVATPTTVVKAPPTTHATTPPVTASPGKCDPNYAGGCVPIASDVDCAGGSGNGPAYVRGPVQVIGIDIYGLDADHDGIGCE